MAEWSPSSHLSHSHTSRDCHIVTCWEKTTLTVLLFSSTSSAQCPSDRYFWLNVTFFLWYITSFCVVLSSNPHNEMCFELKRAKGCKVTVCTLSFKESFLFVECLCAVKGIWHQRHTGQLLRVEGQLNGTQHRKSNELRPNWDHSGPLAGQKAHLSTG